MPELFKSSGAPNPGIDLINCENGEAALDMLRVDTVLPSLILLASAYSANHLTTLEVISAIKADPNWKAIPIVAFTASALPSDTKQWYAAGISCVVPLPSDLDAIEQSLAAIKHHWLNVVALPHAAAG